MFLVGYSLVRVMVSICYVRMGLAGVRALVWTASGMDTEKDWLKYQAVLIVIIV